jgi:short chain dehydrogenase
MTIRAAFFYVVIVINLVLRTLSIAPLTAILKTKISAILPWQVEGNVDPVEKGCYSVVITGGTRGVGLAMAKEFLSMGDSVVICGRDQDRLDRALVLLRSKYPSVDGKENVFGITADVSSYSDVINLGEII